MESWIAVKEEIIAPGLANPRASEGRRMELIATVNVDRIDSYRVAELLAVAPEMLAVLRYAEPLARVQCPNGVSPEYWESVWLGVREVLNKLEH